ncbi:MAG: helix-turn-helix domain-containing protein [Alphaproteobacteria bacterium]|nr:helix-turn-helix domain-containing protein [Alphaproteobacteria bacterium]
MYTHPQSNGGEWAKRLRREAGAWLKAKREAAGLTQKDLAKAVGFEYYTFISQIESGRGRVPPESYRAWAAAIGIEPRDFVKHLMAFYDPLTYEVLFEDGIAAGRGERAG